MDIINHSQESSKSDLEAQRLILEYKENSYPLFLPEQLLLVDQLKNPVNRDGAKDVLIKCVARENWGYFHQTMLGLTDLLKDPDAANLAQEILLEYIKNHCLEKSIQFALIFLLADPVATTFAKEILLKYIQESFIWADPEVALIKKLADTIATENAKEILCHYRHHYRLSAPAEEELIKLLKKQDLADFIKSFLIDYLRPVKPWLWPNAKQALMNALDDSLTAGSAKEILNA